MVPPPFIQFTLSHDLQASKGVLQGRANFCSQQDVNCFIALNSFHICLVGTVIVTKSFLFTEFKVSGNTLYSGKSAIKTQIVLFNIVF